MAGRDWRRTHERDRDWEQDEERRWRGRGPQRSERYSDPMYGREPSRERGGSYDEYRGYDQRRDYDRNFGSREHGASQGYGRGREHARADQQQHEQWDEPGYRSWQQRIPWDDPYANEYKSSDWERDRRQQQPRYRGSQSDWRSESRSPAQSTWSYYEFWLTPGPYTGKGPSDYRRSAERIREDVCDRLESHGEVEASQIKVEANEDGEVTLTGAVCSRREKRLADDVAESVRGVKDVHNQLKVKADQSPGSHASNVGQEGTRSGRTSC